MSTPYEYLSLATKIRKVLADMEVWQQFGTCTSWEPSTSSGEKTYGRPPGESRPPHEEWRERFNRASILEHEKLLRQAEGHLEALRKQERVSVVPETQAELEARVVAKMREGGWTIEQVAQHCRCTTKLARLAWATARSKPKDDPVPVDQREEALRLAGQGMTERQIEMLTKLPKTTVRRVLGRAA